MFDQVDSVGYRHSAVTDTCPHFVTMTHAENSAVFPTVAVKQALRVDDVRC